MLSEKRKADREKMVQALEELADEYKYKTWRVLEDSNEIWLQIILDKGLRCTFEFDGKSPQPNVFVNAWHIAYNYDTKLSDNFPGGEMNQFHRRKCTTVCYGFEELKMHVGKVFEGSKSGEIFL